MSKSWVQKRDCGKKPQIKVLDKPFAGIKQGCRMLISSPEEIDEFIQNLPEGTFMQPSELREHLAKKHKADATCPVSTGIFLRIVSEAALEEKQEGKSIDNITPFWRVVAEDSPTAKKLEIDPSELDTLRQLRP